MKRTNHKKLGGYHPDSSISKWPSGCIFENEGLKLYDTIRKLRPSLVVEIGGFHGCSASYIACALRDNKKGKLISIDTNLHGGEWSKVPEDLKERIEFKAEDALICDVPKNIDVVFEDGLHSPGFTATIIDRFKAKQAFIVHDYFHFSKEGHYVKEDFLSRFGQPDETFFEDPSDCGLAFKYFSK